MDGTEADREGTERHLTRDFAHQKVKMTVDGRPLSVVELRACPAPRRRPWSAPTDPTCATCSAE